LSKILLKGERLGIPVVEAVAQISGALKRSGCPGDTAIKVAEHLADASLCGVESHGLIRVLQYVEQFESGYIKADALPGFRQLESGSYEVDGQGGIGIPAMELAMNHGCEIAKTNGISAIAVRHAGHTGRLGAYAEQAAERGYMIIILGGGNRKSWRQVAPFGGRKAMLPTNPYCIGIPGGEHGPVILDFATAKIAGGWIYAASSAGAQLPEGVMIDNEGRPSTDPEDYYKGGALLPAGGAKGYALGLVAELVAEAMLGPTTTECNWLMITLDTAGYRDPSTMRSIAEEILAECRQCPPLPGFDRVEIPGERERAHKALSNGVISVPEETWKQILAL